MLTSRVVLRAPFTLLLLLVMACLPVWAGEGMWIPLLLKSLNESEMKSMGMKMSADDIYSVNHGSLKDAVVHFGGFCTGEVVSDRGLIFTNHHCGYDAIQSHSTLEKNYLTDGYWAKNLAEELPNPGLYATFIVRIEDVSASALNGVTAAMSLTEKQSVIDKNLNRIKESAQRESWQELMIRPFFEGNQYFMFVTETYRDVRYVGSPPESIGKFGADTDNWVWPRHTGDFSVFRIYAGPDNKPAEYSPNNQPLKPRHYFPVSLDGIRDGDFTLVFGFPGRTTQYLPSFAVQQIQDVIDPARIGVRNISLGIMDKNMRKNESTRLAYAAKYASLANSWKKWIGEAQGLASKHAVQAKEKQESEFTARLQQQPELSAAYGSLLPEMKTLYAELEPIIKNRTILGESIGGANIELFKVTSLADRLATAYKESGEEGFKKAYGKAKDALHDFFKEYRAETDMEIFDALMAHLPAAMSKTFLPASFTSGNSLPWNADEVYASSILISEESFVQTIEQGGAAFVKRLETDRAYQVYLELKGVMDKQLSPAFNRLNDKIQGLQQTYMAALMKTYPEKKFWPDANNTMRVTYGKVEPFSPRDGMTYKTQTYLDGVMEKYKPGDYEFDVHPRLIELYTNKDYGVYGEKGKMPLAFIASNHTTGGNSGSPALDARGNLIGINFDRVWEGTMSDIYYDRSICRNIMVDIRYVLFVIDKFAGAGYLLQEMNLVHPKGSKKRKK